MPLFFPRTVLLVYAAMQGVLLVMHITEEQAFLLATALSVSINWLLILGTCKRIRYTARILSVFIGTMGPGGLVLFVALIANGGNSLLFGEPLPTLVEFSLLPLLNLYFCAGAVQLWRRPYPEMWP